MADGSEGGQGALGEEGPGPWAMDVTGEARLPTEASATPVGDGTRSSVWRSGSLARGGNQAAEAAACGAWSRGSRAHVAGGGALGRIGAVSILARLEFFERSVHG